LGIARSLAAFHVRAVLRLATSKLRPDENYFGPAGAIPENDVRRSGSSAPFLIWHEQVGPNWAATA